MERTIPSPHKEKEETITTSKTGKAKEDKGAKQGNKWTNEISGEQSEEKVVSTSKINREYEIGESTYRKEQRVRGSEQREESHEEVGTKMQAIEVGKKSQNNMEKDKEMDYIGDNEKKKPPDPPNTTEREGSSRNMQGENKKGRRKKIKYNRNKCKGV